MSLYGALYAGVSGLMAQSSAMGAIADNTINSNTIGYKQTDVRFQTLVTKQSSRTSYSSGGVMSRPWASIDVQGLLSSTGISTDMGISGNGFFVVNAAANPTIGNMWSYTRAGAFRQDQDGYLTNTSGYYLQAWPLMPYDGNPNAITVKVNDMLYMKAYKDDNGVTHYLNDNIINADNLKPVNLSIIGGTATPTRQLTLGANLPAGDDIWDESNPGQGRYSMSALIYDSLGNAHNLNVQYTKDTANSWQTDVQIPSGASNLVIYSEREIVDDAAPDVYAAVGQLEFRNIPSNHSFVKLTQNGTDYVFEFSTDGTTITDNPMSPSYIPGANVVRIDIQTGVVTVTEAVSRLQTAVKASIPGGGRFTAESNRLIMTQSPGGSAVDFDASACLQCVQSSSNPNPVSGIPTGKFTVPEIDWALKNTAIINFDGDSDTDYVGNAMIIDGVTYRFTNGTTATSPEVTIDIASAISGVAPGNVNKTQLVDIVMTALYTNAQGPERFVNYGTSIEIHQQETGTDITFDMTGLGAAVSGLAKNNGAAPPPINITSGSVTLTKSFMFNGQPDGEKGTLAAGVRFNSDGTPKYFNVNEISISWANGAQDMTGDPDQGNRISIFQGDTNTSNGLTQLAGQFNPDFARQDGAKFGTYAGVSITEDGMVIALFDNGDRKPIAQIPVATFVNPNGLESLTGNAWYETDYSGAPTLRTANSGGAGKVTATALESSTVDISEQFTNMITTQRAYTSASKIIITADEMLTDLMNIKR